MKPRLFACSLLVLSLACSDFPLEFGKGCTGIGCLTFLRIELVFVSDLQADAVEVVVEHGNESFTCDFGAELDPCHKGFQPEFDPGAAPGAMTDARPLVVLLDDTPQRLTVTVTSANGTESQVIEPEYERNQPNGPDCGPGCLSANTTLRFAL